MGYSPGGCRESDMTEQPDRSSNPDRTSGVGWKHSLCWGPSLPDPSRWTPKPLSSATRQKNPYVKPSTSSGQRSILIPQPVRSIGQEGMCKLAEAGLEGQPGGRESGGFASLPNRTCTRGEGIFLFFNIWLHQVLVLAHRIFVEACRICVVAAGRVFRCGM